MLIGPQDEEAMRLVFNNDDQHVQVDFIDSSGDLRLSLCVRTEEAEQIAEAFARHAKQSREERTNKERANA